MIYRNRAAITSVHGVGSAIVGAYTLASAGVGMFQNIGTCEQVQMICNNDRCGIEQNRHSLPVEIRPPVTILGGRMKKRKEASELEYLQWFFQHCDFGPADDDVRFMLSEQFKKETGKDLPEGYEGEY